MIDKDKSWYTGILNGIASALNKFVSVFKRNGLIYTAIVMILFVAFYSLVINPIRIDRIVEKRFEAMYLTEKAKEAASMNKRMMADDIIGGIMTKIVDKFPDVQRILLLECHNSITTATGTDILFMSATMEMLTPNSRHLNYIAEDLQRQIRHNLMGEILNTLKYRDYMFYDSVQNCNHVSHRIIQKLKSVGDKQALLVPFKDNADVVQIVLIISGDNLNVNEIMEYVNDYKPQIEKALM